MRRCSIWLACATVVGSLLLAACQVSPTQSQVATSTASMAPIATATTLPTATATPVLAPTPLNVPAGWIVLVGSHFSLAYPNGWTAQSFSSSDSSILYIVQPAIKSDQGVRVDVVQAPQTAQSSDFNYCPPPNGTVSRTTLAGLPMIYEGVTGEGQFMRTWSFVNAQRTIYVLDALDAQETSTVQAQDNAILNTFRPDNPAPWRC